MKKKPTVNVKKATQHYCGTCGVICGSKFGSMASKVKCARETDYKQQYYCSMTCCKANIFKECEKNCEELHTGMCVNYIVSKKEIKNILAEDPKRCGKGVFILCKSFKIQAEILKFLRKHDWFSAGLLYRDNKDLFTEAGEHLLIDEKKYMNYLNTLKAIQCYGLSFTSILNIDKEGRPTNNAMEIWE